FFQAEDGIRDFHVTGVQTCALPILDYEVSAVATRVGLNGPPQSLASCALWMLHIAAQSPPTLSGKGGARGIAVSARGGSLGTCRSEERRVGKGCGSGWAGEPE